MKQLLTITLMILLSACTGKVMTASDVNDDDGKAGIYVYPPAQFIDIYKQHKLIDKNGILIATSSGIERNGKTYFCQINTVMKFATRPDYTNPQRVYYDPGMLEENKFGVALKDGQLQSVNSESKPDRGATLSAISEALPNFVDLAEILNIISVDTQGLVFEEEPVVIDNLSCNAGNKFIKTLRAPEVTEIYDPNANY